LIADFRGFEVSFRRTTRGEVSAELKGKNISCMNPGITSNLERLGGACGGTRVPRLGRRAHGEGSDRRRRRRRRKPVWGASLGGRCGRLCGRLVPSLFGQGRRDAPPRSGETGGKGCRRAGRRGRHARGRPGMGSRQGMGSRPYPAQTEGTQPAPKRGRAGRTGAGASASANAGVNAGHTMRDACKRPNRQVGRRERDRGGRAPRATLTRSRHGHGYKE
jgi:hypothetical protein